jgi:site-specific DNA-methyltransferase (adenine-specific)/modification methylase
MRVETIGNATLYLGDCREILPTLEIGALVCDPPYGMAYKSNYNKGIARADLVRKSGDFAPIAGDESPFDPAHLLAIGVPTVLWGANFFADRLPAGNKWLTWDKLAGKTPTPSASDVEHAWTSERGPSRIFTHLWRGIMRAGEENVSRSPKLHPNQKPVALMSWCLEQVKFTGPVCDAYMGSGSTGIACMRAGIPFIGIESDPDHFETALRRLKAEGTQGRLIA